jgi:nitroreductase
METGEAIKARKSSRSFLPEEVRDTEIGKVLDAARLAPSAINLQPWHYVVVRDREQRGLIVGSEPPFNSWMKSAPVLIVACVKRRNDNSLIDLGLSIENLLLRAQDLGLGATPTAVHNKDRVREIIRCPKEFEPLITVALGYPEGKAGISGRLIKMFTKGRKDLAKIASNGFFGQKWG